MRDGSHDTCASRVISKDVQGIPTLGGGLSHDHRF